MKKINILIFIMSFFAISMPNVYASTSKNGITINDNETTSDNTFSLYCSYNGGHYILIDRAATDDKGNIDSDTNLINEASDETLKKYNFMNNDGSLDCPKYIEVGSDRQTVINFVNDFSVSDKSKFHYTLKTNESSCTGKCLNNQTNVEKKIFNCFYLSQNSDKEITISREQEGGKVYITYPDGTKEETSYPITETCQDFYYNTKNKTIKLATYEYLGNISQMQTYDPAMYEFICGSSSENNKDVEYFCAEGCNYNNNVNIKCTEVSSTINKGNINLEEMCNLGGVKNTLKFLGYLLLIVKILVPVLLIVLGVVDYSKATISSDDDAVQKATKSLVTRIIAGIAIFLIPTIINFVFRGLLNSSGSQFNDCRVCVFEPHNCN